MKSNNLLIIGGIGLLAYLLLNSSNANAEGNSAPGNLDLSGLTTDPTDLNHLNQLYFSLQKAGLTNQQILFMLAQCLLESGINTSVANYKRINLNNFAGLKDTSGNYKSYANTDDFVADYIDFLTKKADPISATSLTDFNNRLQQNCYYGCPPETDPAQYLANLQAYYNQLINTSKG